MKKQILTLMALTISAFSLFAQTEATTKDGKKVILNEDGTYKYDKTIVVTETVNLECSKLIATEIDNDWKVFNCFKKKFNSF